MPQDIQLPLLQPFVRLVEANLTLFSTTCLPAAGGPDEAWSANPMAGPVLLMQGMAANYVQFITELNQQNLSLFEAGRGSLVTLAGER